MEIALPNPLKFSHKGETRETQTVILDAPPNSPKSNHIQMKVKASFMQISIKARSLASSQEGVESEDKEPSHQEIAMMLYLGTDKQIDHAWSNFKNLLCLQGVCQLDEEACLQSGEFEMTTLENQETLIGAYIDHFINI